MGEEELAAVRDVFERSWLGMGPRVEEFESAWSRYVGVPTSVAVNSGTAALHLALAACGLPAGSKVLVPAMTFVATATAVLYNDLIPVFVDVDRETLTIDLADLERKADGCSAVMPVHFGGHPVPMDRLLEVARRHRLTVVEDCAHCAGGAYQGRKLGTWGDIGCFSFEEKKGMTTGDGGMISSPKRDLIEPLRAHRWIGIDKDTWKRAAGYTDSAAGTRHWYYEVAVLGYKFNMNDLAAAIGLVQLRKLDAMNDRRREIIARYLHGLRGCRHVRPLLPYQLEDSAYWIFGVRATRRDDFILHMKERGIATGVHYMPVPHHPLFRQYASATPVTDDVWREMVTLPLFAALSDDDVDDVSSAVREFDAHA